MKKKLLLIPWLLYSLLIFTISSMELNNLSSMTIFGWDKVIHFIEYAIFSFLTAVALEAVDDTKYIFNNLFTAFIITVLFAASDEIHQLFVQGRSCSLFDFIADLCGGIIGLIFFHKLKISDKLQHVVFK